jgi:hypothetical protein
LLLRVVPLPGDAVEFFVNTPEVVLGMLRDKKMVTFIMNVFGLYAQGICHICSSPHAVLACMLSSNMS